MTFDAAYSAVVGNVLGIWLEKLAAWLGSQPMFIIFSLTILIYICKIVRTLIGR